MFELLKDFNFTEWDDVTNLLDAQSGKQVFSSTHRLLKDRDYLMLIENNSEETLESISISEDKKQLKTPFGTFFFDEADAIFDAQANVIYVDKAKLKHPLMLRKWEEGDFFYPSGMTGKKKLSKLFKDEKLSLIAKENTWVLCSDDRIVWVVGVRMDDRFKVTKDTNEILRIDYTPR